MEELFYINLDDTGLKEFLHPLVKHIEENFFMSKTPKSKKKKEKEETV